MIKSWKQLSEYNREVDCSDTLKHRQEKWLFECIGRNKGTDYGRKYNFGQIKTIIDYQKQVPIVSYQDISTYIESIAKGGSNCLFAEEAIAFERTSGSTCNQKLIPYSQESIIDFRRAILPWLSALTEQYKIISGNAYWAISPATRQPELTESGIQIGLPDVAYLGEDLMPFFLDNSTVPSWVAEISDVKVWQLVTLYYLVCCNNLSLISVWSPTFLLTLLNALYERRNELEKLLLRGLEVQGYKLQANQSAYANLQNYYIRKEWNVLWPELKVISCWADASSKFYSERLNSYFQGVPIQPKGLLLTEGVVTAPNRDNQTVLTADSGFYEFIDEGQNIKLAHELCIGDKYEVIMTTSGGLYRYRTCDRVVCDGYATDLPILRFLGRELSSDMVGEKLTEEFVTSCLEGAGGFSMLIPFADKIPGYLLIVDDELNVNSVIEKVETRLHENPQYAYACKIGQLRPIRAIQLKDPLEVYLNSSAHAGARLGDIKVPSLCLKTEIFNEYMGDAV